ncbi:hypothetical protein ACTFIR_010102 [Dictyostelium discoideum]
MTKRKSTARKTVTTTLSNNCCLALCSKSNESLAKNKYYFELDQNYSNLFIGKARDIPVLASNLPKYATDKGVSKTKRYIHIFERNNGQINEGFMDALLDAFTCVVENYINIFVFQLIFKHELIGKIIYQNFGLVVVDEKVLELKKQNLSDFKVKKRKNNGKSSKKKKIKLNDSE